VLILLESNTLEKAYLCIFLLPFTVILFSPPGWEYLSKASAALSSKVILPYPFHRQKEGSFCLADCPHVRRAVYSTSQCAPDEFLRNFSIWCFRLELIEVIAKIKDFIPVLSRSSWFVFGAQEVMFRAKQNEPSTGVWDTSPNDLIMRILVAY
jgi:hypothetical protein